MNPIASGNGGGIDLPFLPTNQAQADDGSGAGLAAALQPGSLIGSMDPTHWMAQLVQEYIRISASNTLELNATERVRQQTEQAAIVPGTNVNLSQSCIQNTHQINQQSQQETHFSQQIALQQSELVRQQLMQLQQQPSLQGTQPFTFHASGNFIMQSQVHREINQPETSQAPRNEVATLNQVPGVEDTSNPENSNVAQTTQAQQDIVNSSTRTGVAPSPLHLQPQNLSFQNVAPGFTTATNQGKNMNQIPDSQLIPTSEFNGTAQIQQQAISNPSSVNVPERPTVQNGDAAGGVPPMTQTAQQNAVICTYTSAYSGVPFTTPQHTSNPFSGQSNVFQQSSALPIGFPGFFGSTSHLQSANPALLTTGSEGMSLPQVVMRQSVITDPRNGRDLHLMPHPPRSPKRRRNRSQSPKAKRPSKAPMERREAHPVPRHPLGPNPETRHTYGWQQSTGIAPAPERFGTIPPALHLLQRTVPTATTGPTLVYTHAGTHVQHVPCILGVPGRVEPISLAQHPVLQESPADLHAPSSPSRTPLATPVAEDELDNVAHPTHCATCMADVEMCLCARCHFRETKTQAVSSSPEHSSPAVQIKKEEPDDYEDPGPSAVEAVVKEEPSSPPAHADPSASNPMFSEAKSSIDDTYFPMPKWAQEPAMENTMQRAYTASTSFAEIALALRSSSHNMGAPGESAVDSKTDSNSDISEEHIQDDEASPFTDQTAQASASAIATLKSPFSVNECTQMTESPLSLKAQSNESAGNQNFSPVSSTTSSATFSDEFTGLLQSAIVSPSSEPSSKRKLRSQLFSEELSEATSSLRGSQITHSPRIMAEMNTRGSASDCSSTCLSESIDAPTPKRRPGRPIGIIPRTVTPVASIAEELADLQKVGKHRPVGDVLKKRGRPRKQSSDPRLLLGSPDIAEKMPRLTQTDVDQAMEESIASVANPSFAIPIPQHIRQYDPFWLWAPHVQIVNQNASVSVPVVVDISTACDSEEDGPPEAIDAQSESTDFRNMPNRFPVVDLVRASDSEEDGAPEAIDAQSCWNVISEMMKLGKGGRTNWDAGHFVCPWPGCEADTKCSRDAVVLHMASHLTIDQQDPTVVCSIDPCPWNDYMWNVQAIVDHARLHAGINYECEAHRKKSHPPRRIHCTEDGCDMAFANEKGLHAHRVMKHKIREGKFKCACGKGFTSVVRLAKHSRSVGCGRE